MKNLILLLTITLFSYTGMSQSTFTVNNLTGETLTDIGLVLTNQAIAPCGTSSVHMIYDLASGDFAVVAGVGSEFIRLIGAAGASGSGHRYFTASCGPDDPTPYTFTLVGSEINITL